MTILIRPGLITRYLPKTDSLAPETQNPIAVQPQAVPVIIGGGQVTTTAKTTTSLRVVTPQPTIKPPVAIITPPIQPVVATSSLNIISIPTTTLPTIPPEQFVDAQSIMGILCSFNYSFTDPTTGSVYQGDTERKGSGVIINPRGYVLTNRHLVSWPDEIQNVPIGGKTYPVTIHYKLESCRGGNVPKGSVLPTKSQIQTFNPLTQVPVLAYVLQPTYIHNRPGLSANEVTFADFAVLRITGLTPEGPTFGVSSLPATFPTVKLLPTKNYQITNNQVITYGFPGDVSRGQGSSFETFYLTGSVGTLSNVFYGDQYYAATPLYLKTKMEISSGRSGSPVFWRGYVIGLIMAEDSNNRTISYSVASDVILKDIQSYLN